jgi:hypothetical protein
MNELSTSLDEAHQRIEDDLTRTVDREAELLRHDDALSRLAMHLAAVEVTLYPAVRRRITGGRRLVRAALRRGAELEAVLRELERRAHGDMITGAEPPTELRARLRSLWAAHVREERALAEILAAQVDPSVGRTLAVRLREATERAPSRPHPYALRRLGSARAGYRIYALWDQVLDALDARHVSSRPSRRPRRRLRTVWDAYVLGGLTSGPVSSPEASPSSQRDRVGPAADAD